MELLDVKSDVKFDNWPHVICAQQFTREWLEKDFFPLANTMQGIFLEGGCNILKGKRMVSFFYQSSTRTRMSFEMAIDYLGGRVVFSTDNAREFSSAKKGETFQDTIKVLGRYKPDVIVLRYDKSFGASLATGVSSVPILSAGDREPGQHPTQALLDWLTILKLLGEIDGISIAMVGDLINGRTVRSLSYLLGKFRDVKIHFVSPEHTRMGNDIKAYLDKHNISFEESTDLRKVAGIVDVIYQTRAQTECGTSIDRNDHSLGYFMLDDEVTNLANKDAIFMHPLPRIDEITPAVDKDPRSVYLTHQIDSGLFARMALLKMIISPKS